MSSVDVIVPCYRYAHFLRKCVESVLNQSIQNVRVLIIDDASPDNTAAVAADLVKEDLRVTFIRHNANKGHIASYNEGIEWASADYMLILSADDYLLPGALERATRLMDAHPEVGFVFGNYIEVGDDGTETLVKRLIRPGKFDQCILGGIEFIELSGAYNLVGTCTAVVRTELQKHLGGYRAELPHTGDMMMWLQFAVHASVGFIAAFQGIYRRHPANMSSPYYGMSGRLEELHQRKAALDLFLATSADTLPNAELLRWKLFRSLGTMALGFANVAFNEREIEISNQLAAFGVSVSPKINRSSAWTKLTFKRLMGPLAWRALRPAATALRAAHINLHRFRAGKLRSG